MTWMTAFSLSAVAAWGRSFQFPVSFFHVQSSRSFRVQGVIDSSQHGWPVKRLAEEPADTICECPLLVADHVAPSDQEYRQIRPHFLHQIMKLKAVHRGHANIG